MKVSTVLNAIGTNDHVLSRVTSEKEKARLNEIYRPLEGTLAKDKQESCSFDGHGHLPTKGGISGINPRQSTVDIFIVWQLWSVCLSTIPEERLHIKLYHCNAHASFGVSVPTTTAISLEK